MRFSLACALMTASFSFVAAQTEHTIMVGMGGLTFNPSNITANPGDVIAFQFMAGNHSATQSTFATPCNQLVNTTVTPNVVGISSGFMFIPPGSTSFPQWRFAVTDMTPLWFFCPQANHCQQGMVFSVNANAQKTFDAYLTAAKGAPPSQLAPQTNGQQTPPGGSNGTVTPPVVNGSSNSNSSTPVPNGTPGSSGTDTSTAAAPTKSSARRGFAAPSAVVFAMTVIVLLATAL